MKKAILLALLLYLSLALTLSASAATKYFWQGSQGLEGWEVTGSAWQLTSRARSGYAGTHLESAERATGTLTSKPFTLDCDLVELLVNGWDGYAGTRGANYFALVDAATGELLVKLPPPQNDAFIPLQIPVFNLKHRKVRLVVQDGLSGSGFAWLGLAEIRLVSLEVTASQSHIKALKPSLLPTLSGTWQLLSVDGAGRKTSPYLSSLGRGERGAGSVFSPPFSVDSDTLIAVVRGWAGRDGKRGKTYFLLQDAATGKELKRLAPPLDDAPTPLKVDVAALRGRKVRFVAVDVDTNGAFAWLGLNKLVLGKRVLADFSTGKLPEGWQGNTPARFLALPGVSFWAKPGLTVEAAAPLRLPLEVRARRLFLCGLYNSWDAGEPCWREPRQRSVRLWTGDEIGALRLVYASGKTDVVPLVMGFDAWWSRLWYQGFKLPFGALEKVPGLRLRETGQAELGFAAALDLRPERLARIEVVDNPDKQGGPVLCGLSVETDETSPYLEAVPCKPDRSNYWDEVAFSAKGLKLKQIQHSLEAQRSAFYTTYKAIEAAPKPKVPADFSGPKITFEGNCYARLLTSAYYANVQDMLAKCDADGTWHTSTKDAPSYGFYNGFGTWKEHVDSYYTNAWSRDFGRSLQELAELGYVKVAERCLDWSDEWLMWYPRQFPELQLAGKPVPAHWSRVINLPQHVRPTGNAENDGHALMMLFHYKTWLHSGAKSEFVTSHWQPLEAAADYILWQMDNPDLSGYTGQALRTNSECSGGVGHSVYADYLCSEALFAYAKMARCAGKFTAAARWEKAAKRLRKGIEAFYAKSSPKGDCWQSPVSAWVYGHSDLGPLICEPDRRGFVPQLADSAWFARNLATYERQKQRCWPKPLVSSVCMGYGQGFITQAALLSDSVHDATQAVRHMAEFVYSPQRPDYITPEGVETTADCKYWHRVGDLGNAVQEAEIVKALRLICGVDDNAPQQTLFVPRLTKDLEGLKLEGYPAITSTADGVKQAHLKVSYYRKGEGYRLELVSDLPLAHLAVRVGPFDKSVKHVVIEGLTETSEKRPCYTSGDSNWAWIVGLEDVQHLSVEIQPEKRKLPHAPGAFESDIVPTGWYFWLLLGHGFCHPVTHLGGGPAAAGGH